MISIKNVSFSFFSAEQKALDSVSLDIPDGQFVMITGPSGCGKSTLALVMGGYIPQVFEGQMEGEVFVEGKNASELPLAELATMVGIVQQDPEAQLCTLSVADEVSFGPENLQLSVREVNQRVDESLAMVGCLKLKGRQVGELSGGEKQRVAIASMLAMRPRVLVLDEPTSSLDPTGAAEVLASIKQLRENSGMTIVLIEHRLSRALPMADRLVVMDHGRIIMDGSARETAGRYSANAQAVHRHSSLPVGEVSVHVNDLCFSYGDVEVLHGISFTAHKGEMVGIMGPNGSGKTTFLLHLLGINRPKSGQVQVSGMDASKARTSDLAHKVGYVFQNPNHQIFERTVRGEASFACRNFGFDQPYTDKSVEAVLNRYGLIGYSDRHPLRLSFGEKRRLNLCSILPHGPEIILLDEPFVGQDHVNAARMLEELEALKHEGKTILLVSHDADLVYGYCDRVALFDGGRIIVDSPPEEAMTKIRAMGKTEYLPEAMP
ncbi:MAG TPA: energy-coupling factor transporter ATPase [Methanocellaceae archaeon]